MDPNVTETVMLEPKGSRLRSMLVIGDDLADARDFIGDATTEHPRKLAIPDDVWPPDETLEGVFCTLDSVPVGRAFDIVVVTLRAGCGLQRVRAAIAATMLLRANGHLWMEHTIGGGGR